MADLVSMLAEARIREWEQRVKAGELPLASEPLPLESWETQAFKRIVRLQREARSLDPGPERVAREAEAEKLRLQLIIGLERERPRLARAIDAQIARAVRGEP